VRQTNKGDDYRRMEGSICREGELSSMTLNKIFLFNLEARPLAAQPNENNVPDMKLTIMRQWEI
jgi:hypothetical protein